MLYRRPGFPAVVWFGSLPIPPPISVRNLVRRNTERLRNWDNLLTGEVGRGGEEPNHTTLRKPGPLKIIQYSLGREMKGVSREQWEWNSGLMAPICFPQDTEIYDISAIFYPSVQYTTTYSPYSTVTKYKPSDWLSEHCVQDVNHGQINYKEDTELYMSPVLQIDLLTDFAGGGGGGCWVVL